MHNVTQNKMDFKFSLEEKSNFTIVHLSGRLMDKQIAQPLIDQFDALLKKGMNKFIFDLNKLEYMNSSGLNIMVNFLTKSRNAGGDVAIAAVTDKISQLLVITKLNTLFHIHENVEAAENKLSK